MENKRLYEFRKKITEKEFSNLDYLDLINYAELLERKFHAAREVYANYLMTNPTLVVWFNNDIKQALTRVDSEIEKQIQKQTAIDFGFPA